jgi:N-acetylmuramic acid 6-phosphate etherase
MDSPRTEALQTDMPLDALAADAALCRLLDGHAAALDAIRGALPALEPAAARMAQTLRDGGRLAYGGAGSSGLMAMADALELPGTFGIPEAQIAIFMAGGLPGTVTMPGDTEDDTDQGQADGATLQSGDTAIVVSASGTTPYACAFARSAAAAGATVIGVANVPGSPLLDLSDLPVCIATPPEALAGSTRLGAGTAQKAVLNMMSTLTGVLLGHVHAGQMVNLRADNAKLRDRARRMVARIADTDNGNAAAALERAGGTVKAAILLAAGASDLAAAQEMLSRTGGRLEPALEDLKVRATNTTGRRT